ncbi:MAG TPA: TIGR03435 family protein [Terracidiphilus sp.]|jgi:uncharacterized protein (TIGR03435 family)
MNCRAALALSGSLFAGILLAQPGVRPSFEVESIRPAGEYVGGEGNSRSQIETTADSLTLRNVDLREMVQWAYGLKAYQVLGPGLTAGQRYDVRARSGEAVAESRLRLMLQDLLATRFKVRLHHEQKRISVYELVVARGGPRLPKNKGDTPLPFDAKESLPRVVDGSFVFSNVSIPEFAEQLAELRGIDRPVVDRTGIEGVYDITLKSAASALLEPDGPSLLTLIQEQIGLKLMSAKDPVEVVIVDRVEKPSAN